MTVRNESIRFLEFVDRMGAESTEGIPVSSDREYAEVFGDERAISRAASRST
jgi:hypothetical protein